MYKTDDLKEYLIRMGLHGNETILIHSSMKSIGVTENGADTVLDAFMDFFSEGLLLLPTHTWKTVNADNPVYDPMTSEACVGILPNLFFKRPGVIRSLHPTHSMAGYGKNAKEYLSGEEFLNTPCTPGGCYDRLRKEHGKVLLIGVGHERNTFIHSIEEVLNIPNRLAAVPMKLTIRMPDGTDREVYMRKHYNEFEPHISESFVLLNDEFIEKGAVTKVKFGDADCLLCDCNRLFEVVRDKLAPYPEYFVEEWLKVKDAHRN